MKSLLERLSEYVTQSDIRLYQLAQVAPNAFVVSDDYSDNVGMEIYFDLEHWESGSSAFPQDELTPPGLKEMGMGVISYLCFLPEVKDIGEFLKRIAASSALKPKTPDERWYNEPRWLDVSLADPLLS